MSYELAMVAQAAHITLRENEVEKQQVEDQPGPYSKVKSSLDYMGSLLQK